MKKSLLLVIMVAILLIGIISAEDILINQTGQITQIAINQNLSNFQEKSNNALSKELTIPIYLEKPIKLIFGIKENQALTLSKVILLIILLIGTLVLLRVIISTIPGLEDKLLSWTATILIGLIISTTGGFQQAADYLFSLMNFFDALSKWSILKLITAIIIVTLVIFGLSILTKIIEAKSRPQRARELGFKTSARI